jgi:hypothetical protein
MQIYLQENGIEINDYNYTLFPYRKKKYERNEKMNLEEKCNESIDIIKEIAELSIEEMNYLRDEIISFLEVAIKKIDAINSNYPMSINCLASGLIEKLDGRLANSRLNINIQKMMFDLSKQLEHLAKSQEPPILVPDDHNS